MWQDISVCEKQHLRADQNTQYVSDEQHTRAGRNTQLATKSKKLIKQNVTCKTILDLNDPCNKNSNSIPLMNDEWNVPM